MASNVPSEDPAALPSGSTRRGISPLVVVRAALATLLVFGAVFVLFVATRPREQRLTESEFEAAQARWDKHGPKDYNLDLELAGNRPGKIHIEVRDGEATHMTRDGVEPMQRRVWYYWTVPGQFD